MLRPSRTSISKINCNYSSKSCQRHSEITQFIGLLPAIHQRFCMCSTTIVPTVKCVMPTRGKTANTKGQLSSTIPISWDSSHQAALDSLVTALRTPPILAHPDYTKSSALHTDASMQGLGAVLYQKQDGIMRVISYSSWTLSKAERNYHLHPGSSNFWHSNGPFANTFETIFTMLTLLPFTLTTTHSLMYLLWLR